MAPRNLRDPDGHTTNAAETQFRSLLYSFPLMQMLGSTWLSCVGLVGLLSLEACCSALVLGFSGLQGVRCWVGEMGNRKPARRCDNREKAARGTHLGESGKAP